MCVFELLIIIGFGFNGNDFKYEFWVVIFDFEINMKFL